MNYPEDHGLAITMLTLLQVQAYDADEGENAQLKYTIAERDSQGTPANDLPITVDESTGWIHTKRTLDREVNSKYQFQVSGCTRFCLSV